MDDLSQQVADLARRVRALEDELAINRQIVRYGFAVDRGDADGAAGCSPPTRSTTSTGGGSAWTRCS